MAGAIADTFYEVYKTAANELGLRDRQRKRDSIMVPPGAAEALAKQKLQQLQHQHTGGCACSGASEAAAAGAVSTASNPAASQTQPPPPPPPPPVVDVFDAARRGCMDVLREATAAELSGRDSLGHTVAHWACLHGHLDAVQLLADRGGLELCHRASEHELGQYPIHWACVNGHTQVVERLMRLGAHVDTRDVKGTTPLMVACQYGQTVTAGFLLSSGAAVADSQDAEGDTALHWAAFKGQPDLMRLLVYAGFNPHQRDTFGQSPLHLACLAGNLNAVRDLCRVDKVELNVTDKNGKTPLMLAAGRRHAKVEQFLKDEIRSSASMFGARLRCSHVVFGPPGNTKAPLLFFLFCILVWGYPTYALKAVPLTFHLVPWLHWAFLLANCVMWFSFYLTCTKDPGFLPRNLPEYDRAIKLAGQNSANLGLGRTGNPLERLCHTCRCVKPLRAKHCKVCDRCVLDMDHHCPYVYNCVGRNNRLWFGILTATLMLLGLMTLALAGLTIWQGGLDWLLAFGLVIAIIGSVSGSVVSTCVWYHAGLNLTTNESINKGRYGYLKDANGNFRNPFNRGVVNNLLEFCHLKSPRYSTRELSEIKYEAEEV